jgi:tripartite-type tricarboxylate transporter receptor subunit TctC
VLSAAMTTAEWKADLARHFWTDMFLCGDALHRHLQRERREMYTVLGALGLLSV